MEEKLKPASLAATERAFILEGGSIGHSGSPLVLSGFNKFSIMKEDDFKFVVFSLSHPAFGPVSAP